MDMLALPPSVDQPLLEHGDALDVLQRLPAESVDVCITDPPAGIGFMSKPWDSFAGYVPRTRRGREVDHVLGGGDLLSRAAECLHALSLSSVTENLPGRETAARLCEELREQAKARPLMPAWARGFVVFLVDLWSEVFRVLKPGGIICAWALPRTADLAGLALRAADFDTGESRGWVELADSVVHLFGSGMTKTRDVGRDIDKLHGATREDFCPRTDGRYAYPMPVSGRSAGIMGDVVEREPPRITAPATEDAKRWTGWYRGIAPGHEVWQIGRKPSKLTAARQVLTHGCGLFNVGDCRIPRGEADRDRVNAKATQGAGLARANVYGEANDTPPFEMDPGGSHPRNVILTRGGEQCPVEAIDRQSGVLTSGDGAIRRATAKGHQGAVYGTVSQPEGTPQISHAESGGASRYFTRLDVDDRIIYCAKNSDRSAGLRVDIENTHATPKNVKLMRHLVRLLVPKAEHTGDKPAIVLDPCMGSGSTGVACIAEGVRFIGIEREPQTVRSIITAPAESGTIAARDLQRSKKTGSHSCSTKRSSHSTETCGLDLDESCSPTPHEIDSFGIAHARIMAAIGSPEAAAEANERAPEGAQLSLL